MSYKITLEIGKNEISAWVDDDSLFKSWTTNKTGHIYVRLEEILSRFKGHEVNDNLVNKVQQEVLNEFYPDPYFDNVFVYRI